ncbi:MAG: hypoxanthine phosphoribosyltransferase [bacterium]
MLAEIKEILIDQEQLQQRIQELGAEISRDYQGKELHLICVLKGAVLFLADLARNLTVPVSFDFMAVSSYGASTETSGVVRILKDLEESIEGKDVLIVEDIIDSGLTLHYLYQNLHSRKPASLEICTLLDKPDRRRVDVPVKYCGFSIPDRFVVGYGLDFAEKYRNLPYIGVLKNEVYS